MFGSYSHPRSLMEDNPVKRVIIKIENILVRHGLGKGGMWFLEKDENFTNFRF